jgi:2-polyprenyl-3-methyl-5-hydroxy-6-metoxy-1,4-benzoquinol methylase
MNKTKWFLVKLLGLERAVWNLEWAVGRWDYLNEANPTSIEIVRRYARCGRVIELACGDGALAESIGSEYYTSYKGTDISDKAIERAKARLLSRCEFKACRMEDWKGEPADIVVIRDALCYLDANQQINVLKRAVASVAPYGAVYITVFDADPALLRQVRSAGHVLEERQTVRYHIVIAPSASARKRSGIID